MSSRNKASIDTVKWTRVFSLFAALEKIQEITKALYRDTREMSAY